MFILIGSRWKGAPLGQFSYPCTKCGKSVVHTAGIQKGKLTVFFIPLIPIGKKYILVCNLCGLRRNPVGDLLAQIKGLEQRGQLAPAGHQSTPAIPPPPAIG
jgi:hypothetical protein